MPDVAVARPDRKGRYYVRQPFPSTNRSQARFPGDGQSAPVDTRVDAVAPA